MGLGSILEAFGTMLGSKSHSKFGHDFGMYFCGLPPPRGDREGTSGGLQGDFEGTLARVLPSQIPPGRRPFRARRDHITASGSQERDPTRHGPEAPRIVVTRLGALGTWGPLVYP